MGVLSLVPFEKGMTCLLSVFTKEMRNLLFSPFYLPVPFGKGGLGSKEG